MPELRFRHLDGEKWQEVRALEIDGRRAVVREKWLDFTPAFLSLYAEWDPGMMVHKHGHNSDHVVYVIKGEMTCGDVVCKAGMHITLEKGAVGFSLETTSSLLPGRSCTPKSLMQLGWEPLGTPRHSRASSVASRLATFPIWGPSH